VAVHDPNAFTPPQDAVWERVRISGRRPFVEATFEGKHRRRFLFDTGFQGEVHLNADTVSDWDLLRGRETTPRKVLGIAGVEDVRVGPAKGFRVFGRTREAVEAQFAGRSGGPSDPYTAGTFGLPALGRGTVLFDYPGRRVGFVPRPE
jgi:hypothetical protein